MKKYFAILLFTLIALIVKAQTIEDDILILKDGSLYRGKIIDSTHAEKIKIECYDRNIYVFNRTDISEIKKGPADLNFTLQRFRYNKKNADLHLPYFDNGFKIAFETLYGLNISKANSNNFNYSALLVSLGYRYNKGAYIGLLSGINYLSLFKKPITNNESIPDLYFYISSLNKNVFPKRLSIPIILNYQQTIFFDKISSVLSLNFGYDYNITSSQIKSFEDTRYIAITNTRQIFKWSNSLILYPEIKNIIPLSKKTSLLASFGIMQNNIDFEIEQSTTINYNNTTYTYTNMLSDSFRYRFIYLKFGVGF